MSGPASLEERSRLLFARCRAEVEREQALARGVFLAVGPNSSETEILSALEAGETLFRSEREAMNRLIPYVAQELSRMGEAAYEAENYLLAEYAYRVLALSNGPLNEHAKICLAAMIRRGELPLVHLKKYSFQDALELLKPGIANRSVFALVNAALLYAVCFEDWRSACGMVARIQRGDLLAAALHGCPDREEADPDNMLLHFLLIRTGRMKESFYDSWDNLSEYVYETNADVPKWLFVGSEFLQKQTMYHKGQLWRVVLTIGVKGKHYIAFTDGRQDEHGVEQIRARRYFPGRKDTIRDGMFLMRLTEEEEDMIQWWLDVLQGVGAEGSRDRCCPMSLGFE